MKKTIMCMIILSFANSATAGNILNCLVSTDQVTGAAKVTGTSKNLKIEKGSAGVKYAEPILLEDTLGNETNLTLTIGHGSNLNGLLVSEVIYLKIYQGTEKLYFGAVFSENGKFHSVSSTTMNGGRLMVAVDCK